MHGVEKTASIIAIRAAGCGKYFVPGGIVDGIEWVLDNVQYPAVINLSAGTVSGVSTPLNQAAQSAIDQGITFVTSAGNAAVDACTVSPSSNLNVITVGNSEIDDTRSPSSNFGACVDLCRSERRMIRIQYRTMVLQWPRRMLLALLRGYQF